MTLGARDLPAPTLRSRISSRNVQSQAAKAAGREERKEDERREDQKIRERDNVDNVD